MNQDRILGPVPQVPRRRPQNEQGDTNRLKIIRAKKSGKRFVGCEGYPDCDQTYGIPQRGDLIRLEENCSICGQTPRLKVWTGRRPWNLCLNEECPSMEEMRAHAPSARPPARPRRRLPRPRPTATARRWRRRRGRWGRGRQEARQACTGEAPPGSRPDLTDRPARPWTRLPASGPSFAIRAWANREPWQSNLLGLDLMGIAGERSAVTPQLDALVERGAEAGCVELSEISELIAELGLEESDVDLLFERLRAARDRGQRRLRARCLRAGHLRERHARHQDDGRARPVLRRGPALPPAHRVRGGRAGEADRGRRRRRRRSG